MASRIHILLALTSVVSLALAMIGDNICTPQTECHECARTYTISDRHIAVPIGCYKSKGDTVGNALPYSSGSNHRVGAGSLMNWKMWNCTGDATQVISEFCGKEAINMNKKFFGVEFYGECYFGEQADIDPTMQGLVDISDCDKRCKWDVGAPDTMMIYRIDNVLDPGYTCTS